MRRKGTSNWWTGLWRFLSSAAQSAQSCINTHWSFCQDGWPLEWCWCFTKLEMWVSDSDTDWWPQLYSSMLQSSGGVKTCFWIHHPCIISPWTMTMGQSGFLFRGSVLRMPFIYNLFHHLIRFLTVMPAKIDFVTIHFNFNWFCFFYASVCFQHRCLMCNLQEHILSNYCIFQYLWTTSWPLLSAWCLGSCSRSSAPCASSSSAASPTQ